MDLWQLTDLETPWCIHVVATLGIADHIAAGKGEIGELAAAAGAHAESLLRVLRHLAGKGVFVEVEPGRFGMNELAKGLAGDGRLGLDLDGIGGRMAYAWGTLLAAVRTGRPAYDQAFGCGFWEDLDQNPGVAASFDALMGPAGHGIPDPDVLIDPADWEHVRMVVDVGGGTGTLLAEILRTQPHVRGTLVDLPRTVARSKAVFEAAGVAGRATAVAQSFFDPLPAGGDLYLLKNLLADWPDREATALLKRCAEAAGQSGRVVVLGGVTQEPEASPELLMMVLVGGKNRTIPEFEKVAEPAGLKIRASDRKPSGRLVVECIAR